MRKHTIGPEPLHFLQARHCKDHGYPESITCPRAGLVNLLHSPTLAEQKKGDHLIAFLDTALTI